MKAGTSNKTRAVWAFLACCSFLMGVLFVGSRIPWTRIDNPLPIPVVARDAVPVPKFARELPQPLDGITLKPAVAADPIGRVLVVAYGVQRNQPETLRFWRSVDVGQSWVPPIAFPERDI